MQDIRMNRIHWLQLLGVFVAGCQPMNGTSDRGQASVATVATPVPVPRSAAATAITEPFSINVFGQNHVAVVFNGKKTRYA